jgi:hypothetical protein
MISIRTLFENFRLPWSSQNKFKLKKKKLPGTPLTPNGGAFNRIKKMSNKLAKINKNTI